MTNLKLVYEYSIGYYKKKRSVSQRSPVNRSRQMRNEVTVSIRQSSEKALDVTYYMQIRQRVVMQILWPIVQVSRRP